jgi:DNA repair protein RecN (Recombination protein N)
MLRTLTVRDFVIVESMELDFGRGFTVLTGETGAGKSILIDALGMVLGERGDALVVRQGAARAEISAEFSLDDTKGLTEWLKERDIPDDEGMLLVRRVVDGTGRSRAYINGAPATLAQLREAGEFLVDIHGQHQHQSLSRPAEQRRLLDGYGSAQSLVANVQQAWRDWQRHRERRIAFEKDAASLAAERQQLEWQMNELDALRFVPEQWQELQAEHGRLGHAAALIEGTSTSLDAISEGDDALLSRLNAVVSQLEHLVQHDGRLQEVVGMLDSARIQLQESAYTLRHYGDRLESDPARLSEVERGIDAVLTACRKFRLTPETLPAALDQVRSRLAELEGGGSPDDMKRQEDDARAACIAAAGDLTAARRKAADRLSKLVTKAMQTLAMEGGRFEVALEPLTEPAAFGMEQIEFRVAAHQGMPALALGKVASGGELSRLSLAIQTVTSQVAHVPTLLFDEVDTGIGGRVAEIVGRLLRELGRDHQVMCITHLPQVAASADQQWQVVKTSVAGKPSSHVKTLARDERIDEIARMLGGARITDTTRRHAAEMLESGEAPAATPARKR